MGHFGTTSILIQKCMHVTSLGSTLRKEHKDYAALLRLRNMRRANGIVNESTCWIILDTITKYARYHEDFFRAGRVGIKGQELGAGINFENLGLGTVRTLPEDTLTKPRKDFLYRKVSPIRRNYAVKINHFHTPSTEVT